MTRTDSVFSHLSPSQTHDKQSCALHEMSSSNIPASNTPTRPRTKRSKSSSQTASEKGFSASPSDISTDRAKSRGHASKTISQRTSRTVVDPSRPTRHHRIKSSNTVPTINSHDIDDVLALHFHSCSLFQPSSPITPTEQRRPSMCQRTFSSPILAVSRTATEGTEFLLDDAAPKHSEDTVTSIQTATSTNDWMSPSTRQRDYERIDKANSGVRGLVRKMMPRSMSGPQERFYEKDTSDTASVRRYRMDDEGEGDMEKQGPWKEGKVVPASRMTSKRWTCF